MTPPHPRAPSALLSVLVVGVVAPLPSSVPSSSEMRVHVSLLLK